MNQPTMEDNQTLQKKVIFLSLADGTEEDLHDLHKILSQVPDLVENYYPIFSAKAIQTVDPMELIEQLTHIYDGLPTEQGDQRWRDVRRFMQHMLKFAIGVSAELESHQQMFTELSQTLMTSDPVKYLNLRQSIGGPEQLKTHVNCIEVVTPKEAQKW